MFEEPFIGVDTFRLHRHESFQPENILLGLFEHRLPLIDQMLRCSDLSLVFGQLIAQQLLLQHNIGFLCPRRRLERGLSLD